MLLHYRKNLPAMTLVELLVALMVASIIFGGVASLVHAVGNANDSTEDISFKQAQVRHVTLRLSEMIRNSRLITLSGAGDDLAVWRADDNGNSQIDPSEIVYIEAGSGRNFIALLEFPGAPDWGVPLEELISGDAKVSLELCFETRRGVLIGQCSNVDFYPAVINPQSRFVSISFDMSEGGQNRHYQLNAAVRCWAGNLVDGTGIVEDDD